MSTKLRLTIVYQRTRYSTIASGPVRPPWPGELELAVVDHLWTDGEGEAKSVHEVLGENRGITVNTVQSTLERLYE
jgi:penicillinase repressor